MIWKLAHESWERLPYHAKGYIDLDDLHAECLMALWKMGRKWSPERGAFSTFAHWVARTHLMSVAEKFQAQMRKPPVPLVSLTGLEGESLEVPDPRL